MSIKKKSPHRISHIYLLVLRDLILLKMYEDSLLKSALDLRWQHYHVSNSSMQIAIKMNSGLSNQICKLKKKRNPSPVQLDIE